MFHVFIKPFKADGTYETNFTEFTDFVLGGGVSSLIESLDNTEFDIGIYRHSNINIRFDNRSGKFDDADTPQSIFKFKRSGSLVKVTWEMGDKGAPICGLAICGEAVLSGEVDLFIGLLNDESSSFDPKNDIINFPVLGRLSILERTEVNFSSISNGENISTIMKTLLNQTEITDVLTFAAANIVPATDLAVDDISGFENETVKSVLDELLLISNSVLYVDGDSIIVAARTFAASSTHTFFGQASPNGPENIEKISKIKNGINSIINLLKWDDTAIAASDSSSITNNGVKSKKFKVDSITNDTNRQTLLDSILAFFKDKKQELSITTGLDYDTIALSLLDRVTIDYPTVPFSTEADIPLYGASVYGTAKYPTPLSAFTIENVDYGILERRIGIKNESIEFKLREV